MSTSRYHDYQKLLQQEGSDDSPPVFLGVILGLLANGFEEGSKELRDKISDILNGGEPLPGSLIAMITELSIDAQKALKQGKIYFIWPDDNREKLTALSALCYGCSLSLPFKRDGSSHNNSKVMDDIITLSEITRVDEDGEYSEEDFEVILEFISKTVLKIYNLKP